MRIIRLSLLALIMVSVALVSALTAMRLAIHGREVVVPRLVGLTPAEAENAAGARGLRMTVESRFYSGDVPAGRIVSQLPQPGTRVRRGWEMRVAESLGPQRATIPDVVGESDRAAEINIHRRGLDVGSVMTARIPGLPVGQVIGQSPLPNASGVESPKMNLLLNAPDAQPAFVMPEFVGHRIGEAARAIDEAGLKLPVGEAEVLKRTGGTAIILHQSPAPGQKVVAGTIVNFDLAGEPPSQPSPAPSDAQPSTAPATPAPPTTTSPPPQ